LRTTALKLVQHLIICHCLSEIAQLTSYDSGIAETPETDESVSVSALI